MAKLTHIAWGIPAKRSFLPQAQN